MAKASPASNCAVTAAGINATSSSNNRRIRATLTAVFRKSGVKAVRPGVFFAAGFRRHMHL
jgi:hypothetical protein